MLITAEFYPLHKSFIYCRPTNIQNLHPFYKILHELFSLVAVVVLQRAQFALGKIKFLPLFLCTQETVY